MILNCAWAEETMPIASRTKTPSAKMRFTVSPLSRLPDRTPQVGRDSTDVCMSDTVAGKDNSLSGASPPNCRMVS
jgi:hypothetical protein